MVHIYILYIYIIYNIYIYNIYIYIQCNISHKKEWNNAICSNIDGRRDYHTKWSKPDRERQISYIITYMWNLKNDTNELIYKTEIDPQT